MHPKLLLLLAMALLFSACDSSGPAPGTPTAVSSNAVITPPPWGELPTPPAEITKSQPDGFVTLTHEQGATLFPARVLARDTSSRSGFQEANVKEIEITVELKNNTGHDIAKFSGPILLNDASGAVLDSQRAEALPPIKAGASITQTASFTDIADMESRQKLKEIPLEQLKAEFRPQYVTYADGTSQEITYAK